LSTSSSPAINFPSYLHQLVIVYIPANVYLQLKNKQNNVGVCAYRATDLLRGWLCTGANIHAARDSSPPKTVTSSYTAADNEPRRCSSETTATLLHPAYIDTNICYSLSAGHPRYFYSECADWIYRAKVCTRFSGVTTLQTR